ncbi:MAG TPA: cache domain-containing protein, partial [Stellaceae bacterium]|nr:cache domain-containing protein [Stellaceae bacterium]
MSWSASAPNGEAARTPSQYVMIAVIGIAVAIVGSFGFDQKQRYDEALARADRDTLNAAILVAETTARTFEDIDATLGAVILLQRDAEAGVRRDKATLFRLMRIINDTSPMIDVVGWFDAGGDLIVSSLAPDRPSINIADREYFIAQRDGAAKGLFVAAPVQSRANGAWIITMSRRLETSDGRFAGVVSALIDPAYFASIFRAVELGPGRIGALFRADGTVLAREPQLTERLGQSAATAAWFREQVPSAPSGTYRGRSVFDGSERILSFAKVAGGAQIASVSVPRSEALAVFYRNLVRSGVRYGVLLLLLFAGTWLLLVQLRRRQRADGRFRDLLESAPEAMVIAEPSGRIALVNAQM